MSRVIILPSNIELQVFDGESVAAAAWRQGYIWPTTCWGKGECGICVANVVEGSEYTVLPSCNELKTLRDRVPRFLYTATTRLGCCLEITRDGVVIEKAGVTKYRK